MIFADTPTKRMTTIGPSAIIGINQTTVLERQLSICKGRFANSLNKIIIGFKPNKILKKAAIDNCMVCVNEKFQEESPIHCIARYKGEGGLLIIPCGLIFSQNIFSEQFEESGVITVKKYLPNNLIGVSDVDGFVGQFCYEFEEKSTGILYLDSIDAALFCSLTANPRHKNFLVHEILNLMINDYNRPFKIYRPKKTWALEIERPEQIKRVERLCLKS